MKAAVALKKAVAMFEDFDVPMEGLTATDGRSALHLVLKPTKAVRMKEIQSYEKDLCFALGTKEVVVTAPILGTSTIGITVPKEERPSPPEWKKIRASATFKSLPSPLSVILGKDEQNDDVIVDIATLPHLLIGGAVGTGKSTSIHNIVCTLIARRDQSACVSL